MLLKVQSEIQATTSCYLWRIHLSSPPFFDCFARFGSPLLQLLFDWLFLQHWNDAFLTDCAIDSVNLVDLTQNQIKALFSSTVWKKWAGKWENASKNLMTSCLMWPIRDFFTEWCFVSYSGNPPPTVRDVKLVILTSSSCEEMGYLWRPPMIITGKHFLMA